MSSVALHLYDSFIHLAGWSWNFKKSSGFILHRAEQSQASPSGLKQTHSWGPQTVGSAGLVGCATCQRNADPRFLCHYSNLSN